MPENGVGTPPMRLSDTFFHYIPCLRKLGENVDGAILSRLWSIIINDKLNTLRSHIPVDASEEEAVCAIANLYQTIHTGDSLETDAVGESAGEIGTFNPYAVLNVPKVALLKCHRCGGNEVGYVLRQTRSADEGMTCMCTCRQCGCVFVL